MAYFESKVDYYKTIFFPNRETNISELHFEFAGDLMEKGSAGILFRKILTITYCNVYLKHS